MVSMWIVGVLSALTVVASAKEYYRPEWGRQVYPLVPIGSDAGTRQGTGTDSGTGTGTGPVNPPDGGNELRGSGAVPCVSHVDCYGYREPDDWCPLPAGGVYRDSGCYCDRSIGQCIIDRIVAGSKQSANCISKGASRC